MKRGCPDHPKTYALAEALGIRRVYAVGYLEMLFHFTAQYAPQGDVGRYSDKRIAAGLDWAGSPAKLIDALVTTGWLDRHSGARLVVHDWADHADRTTLQRLTRAGKTPLATVKQAAKTEQHGFKTERQPCGSGITGLQYGSDTVLTENSTDATHQDTVEVCTQSETNKSTPPEPVPEPVPVPNTPPNPQGGTEQAKPRKRKEPKPRDPLLLETAERLCARHPVIHSCGQTEACDQLESILARHKARAPADLLAQIDRNHEGMCATEQWTKDGGRFAKGLTNWLAPTKDRYLQPPPPECLSLVPANGDRPGYVDRFQAADRRREAAFMGLIADEIHES